MVAEVALDPRSIVSDVSDRAHDLRSMDAPKILTHAVRVAPPLSPVREDTDLTGLHEEWARLHGISDSGDPSETGVRGRIRRKVRDTAAEAAAPGQRENRALIGALIRSTEALAIRCDELAGRLSDLEAVLEEVVSVVSEDLVHIRAALSVPGEAGPGRAGPASSAPTRGAAAKSGTAKPGATKPGAAKTGGAARGG